jgi:hypothetical protein
VVGPASPSAPSSQGSASSAEGSPGPPRGTNAAAAAGPRSSMSAPLSPPRPLCGGGASAAADARGAVECQGKWTRTPATGSWSIGPRDRELTEKRRPVDDAPLGAAHRATPRVLSPGARDGGGSGRREAARRSLRLRGHGERDSSEDQEVRRKRRRGQSSTGVFQVHPGGVAAVSPSATAACHAWLWAGHALRFVVGEEGRAGQLMRRRPLSRRVAVVCCGLARTRAR